MEIKVMSVRTENVNKLVFKGTNSVAFKGYKY